MLSHADNDLLCRVGPGTPMGALMREFWVPVLVSSELEADGPPLRVRLLGEDMVAWRDTEGKVGFIADHCPHRGASLFFGRNEESGIRCVYHGWKFDASGNCVDMPNEPPESNFKDKIRARAYPAAERGDMIFVYMGPREEPPPLPDLEWTLVPAEQRRFLWKQVRECNWLQALEGDVDSSHINYLHRKLDRGDPKALGLSYVDGAPRIELVRTDYGLNYGARRTETGDGSYYWRTTHYMLPFYTLFPADPSGVIPEHTYLPIDDTSTLVWCHQWHPYRPLTDQDPSTGIVGDFRPATGEAHSAWRTVANLSNDFLIDRDRQRRENYTGIPQIQLQDTAVEASMGPIMDRTKEHLGQADAAVILARRLLLDAVKKHRDAGTVPPLVDRGDQYRLRSAAVWLPPDRHWRDALDDWHHARADLPREYVRAGYR